jgi:predicted ATP-grasp superfamily ATP-dependent carboligase
MTALITCGHTRAGLAATRALGRAGLAVAVAAPVRPALGMWSRYATSTFLVPDAGSEARRFAEAVAHEAAGRRAELILSASDSALWALSRWRAELPEGARRVMPPHDAVARALDRTALHDRARSLGIASIQTFRIDVHEALEPALRKLDALGQVPVIIRPIVPWVEREDGTRRVAESIPVEELGDVRRLLYAREDLVRAGCLLEPRPPGRWIGYGAVCDEGRVLAEVFQERLRERGDLSGVSTLARTLPPDEEVRHAARAILESLSWQGPALVELFRGEDGVLRLVNIIGRLWGSLGLAILAGVNVPLLCADLARGRPGPHAVLTAEPDHVWRWIVGDLDVMAKRARKLATRLEGKAVLRRRVASLRELVNLNDLLFARPDVFDADDPLPFVLEVENRFAEARRDRLTA